MENGSDAGLAVWQSAVAAAMLRAEHNTDLHIERDVYHEATARAVVQEFNEQLNPLLGIPAKETVPAAEPAGRQGDGAGASGESAEGGAS